MQEDKSKSKKKVKKLKQNKCYVQGEVNFPIYVFNSSLERTVKIKDKDSLFYMGLHLGSVLTCIRDKTTYRNHYFSYNKSI